MDKLTERYEGLEAKLLRYADEALTVKGDIELTEQTVKIANDVHKMRAKQATLDSINNITESLNKLADHADSLVSLTSFFKR